MIWPPIVFGATTLVVHPIYRPGRHMTLKERILAEIAHLEPNREEISTLGKTLESSVDFVAQITPLLPYWKYSSMARLIFAKILFGEKRMDESRDNLEAAEALWVQAAELGDLTLAALDFLRTSVMICHCKVDDSLSKTNDRDKRIATRRQQLAESESLSSSEVEEENARIVDFLENHVSNGLVKEEDFGLVEAR